MWKNFKFLYSTNQKISISDIITTIFNSQKLMQIYETEFVRSNAANVFETKSATHKEFYWP